MTKMRWITMVIVVCLLSVVFAGFGECSVETEEEEILRIVPIFFDSGRYIPTLRSVQDYLEENVGTIRELTHEKDRVVIEVGGYSDKKGNAKLNYRLAQKRANWVKKKLTRLGISPRWLKVKSYGSTKATQWDSALERKVVLSILSIEDVTLDLRPLAPPQENPQQPQKEIILGQSLLPTIPVAYAQDNNTANTNARTLSAPKSIFQDSGAKVHNSKNETMNETILNFPTSPSYAHLALQYNIPNNTGQVWLDTTIIKNKNPVGKET